MASSDVCQQHFEQGVACAMHLWPHLDDAVEDQLGGSDSADKRDWFVGSVVDLFPDLAKSKQERLRDQGTAEEPEQYDVEYRILQVMDDEFQLKIEDDDDSAYRLAEQIMRLREQCLRGTFTEVGELSRRFSEKEQSKKNKQKARNVVIREEDNETDWDSQDDEEEDDSDHDQDVDMDEAPALVPAKREKPEPEVDEDGFTKVTRKKK